MGNKRPLGRPPIGAVWLEDEGRYEYTQEYFRHREQSFISTRLKLKEQYKKRPHILKVTQRNLWKFQKRRHTRAVFACKSSDLWPWLTCSDFQQEYQKLKIYEILEI